MITLIDLPAEVLTRIFLCVDVQDCLNLARTSRFLNEVSKSDFLWEKKICQDYKIDLKSVSCSGTSPRSFYRFILYKYGKMLGLWQATSYGHRGGLFQVSTKRKLHPLGHILLCAYDITSSAVSCKS